MAVTELFDISNLIRLFTQSVNLWFFGASMMVLTTIPAAQGHEACGEREVSITTRRDGNNVHLFVKNERYYDITISISAELKNMAAQEELPYTETIPARQVVKALTFSIVDPAKPWHWKYVYHSIFGSKYANHEKNCVYLLPYPREYSFMVSQGFNGKFSHFGNSQHAIDWKMPEGTPICATRGGVVVDVVDHFSESGTDPKFLKMDNHIMIRHSDGTIGKYCHFQQNGAVVHVGQTVEAGELIGYSGNTGYSTGPHLHFEVCKAIDGKTQKSFPITFSTHESNDTILVERKVYAHPSVTGGRIAIARSEGSMGR